jgi:hypothetical protein
MNQCFIDHITVSAPHLESGAEFVKKSLGVAPQKGGEHPRMGTHNLLLRLGKSVFLEVIACNPMAQKPTRPRWFALDKITKNAPAKLISWVVRTDNICSSLDACPESLGKIEALSRDELNWLMTIPEDGSLPINEGGPALIEWKTDTHPATKLRDQGLSFIELQIYNPEADRIESLLDAIKLAGDVKVFKSKESKMVALINTPGGTRVLSD